MLARAVLYLTIGGLFLASVSRTALGNYVESRNPNGVVLTARKWKDEKRTLPGSMLYAADLLNNSNKTVTLEAIQMAEGFAGGGTIFQLQA